ncbi:hypothetical protein [Francisella tularensis]|uniref:hypothetical protein n=1 Tax=Francisella tularensis TaxID=263 RepID=UPI0008F471AF|nr:hypothetical protein [Francisella tularensis]APA82863.1 hypothetical protein N894_0879 [Francisella tularensis subsp. novicida PA10-7858]
MTFKTFVSFLAIVIVMYYLDKVRKKGKTIYLLNAFIVPAIVVGVLMTANMMYEGIRSLNLNEDLHKPRDKIKIEGSSLYNAYTLDSNLFTYLPNSHQLKNNIPKCVDPVSRDISNYIDAYNKIYNYLVSTGNYSDKKRVGGVAKAVLDFNYNYHESKIFREIYLSKIEDGNYKSVADFIETDWSNTYGNKDFLYNILNKNFNKKEQDKLAQETLSIYKQASNNCIQAGYGKEFYSVFWANFAPINISDSNTVLMMQKSMIALIDYAIHNKVKIKNDWVDGLNEMLIDNHLSNIDINTRSYIYMDILIRNFRLNNSILDIVMIESFLYQKSQNGNSEYKKVNNYLRANNGIYDDIDTYFKLRHLVERIKSTNNANHQDLDKFNDLCKKYLQGFNNIAGIVNEYESLRSDYIYKIQNMKYVCNGNKEKAISYNKKLNKYYK